MALKSNSLQTKVENCFEDKEDLVSAVNRYREYYSREILLTSITPESAEKISTLIRYWNSVDDYNEETMDTRLPIKIVIDSHGGSLSAAFTIIDAIKSSKTPVYTLNIGTCYKEALFIFLMGLKRYSYPRASFQLETVITVFSEDNKQSNYDNFIQKQANELKQIVLEKTGMSESEYDKRNVYWMDADTAYTNKFCNEILRNGNGIF